MAAHHFFSDEAKQRVASAIKAVERQTAAEVVVAVRPSSASYRDVDYLAGAGFALLVLCALLFSPISFSYSSWPLELMAAFAVGAYACRIAPPFRRLLVRDRRRDHEVARAAKAAFVDLGVARTHRRAGILVYVSLFEKRAELVADWAVPRAAIADAARAIDAAIARRHDIDGFIAALTAMGEPLGRELPHHEGDVNELPDEVDESDEEDEEARE